MSRNKLINDKVRSRFLKWIKLLNFNQCKLKIATFTTTVTFFNGEIILPSFYNGVPQLVISDRLSKSVRSEWESVIALERKMLISHGNAVWDRDKFYLLRLNILLSYIYMLPYSYSMRIRNRISSRFSTGLSIPVSSIYQMQCYNILSNKELTSIDDYDYREGREWGCEMWKMKREKYEKWVSSDTPKLWLYEWNYLGFEFLFI